MKKFRLLLMAVCAVMCSNVFSQTLDIGVDYDGSQRIDALSGIKFSSEPEYLLEDGEFELNVLIGGDAQMNNSSNNAYDRSGALWCPYMAGDGQYVEGNVGETNKKITWMKINGVTASEDKTSIPVVLFSDQSPFDPSRVLGYVQIELAPCRSGDAGNVIDDIPDGTKSFRVYRTVSVIENEVGYEVSTEEDAEKLGVVDTNEYSHARVHYINVFLEDGAPAEAPTIILTSAESTTDQYVIPGMGFSIAPITYRFGGTATGATVTWNETPAGINVDTDGKVVTISGTPTANGYFEYSITATDGSQTTAALTGQIIVQPTERPVVGYVTNSLTPTDEGDIAVIEKLSEKFAVVIILSTEDNVDFDKYDAIVLAALPASADPGMYQYKTIQKPFVNIKPFMFQASRWNWGTPVNIEVDSSDDMVNTISISDDLHPVFANLSNSFEVAMSTGSKHNKFRILTPVSTWIGNNGNNVETLANAVYMNSGELVSQPVVFSLMEGSVMEDDGAGDAPIDGGVTITQPNIHIGVSEQAAGYLTDDFLTMVSNAACYVLDIDVNDEPLPLYPPKDGNSIGKDIDNNKVEVDAEYYDIMGRRVSKDSASGYLIKKSIYEDGSVSFGKIYIRK